MIPVNMCLLKVKYVISAIYCIPTINTAEFKSLFCCQIRIDRFYYGQNKIMLLYYIVRMQVSMYSYAQRGNIYFL